MVAQKISVKTGECLIVYGFKGREACIKRAGMDR